MDHEFSEQLYLLFRYNLAANNEKSAVRHLSSFRLNHKPKHKNRTYSTSQGIVDHDLEQTNALSD
jgi:hypothetical protein